jgi:tuftelin-interacting protein 11
LKVAQFNVDGQSTIRQDGRLAELLHNVNLLADMSHQDLLQISRQSKLEQLNLEKDVEAQEALKAYVSSESKTLKNIKRIMAICEDCRTASKQSHLASSSWEEIIDETYGEHLDELLKDHYKTFIELKLDSFVVSLIHPSFVKRAMNWEPLTDEKFAVNVFKDYKKLLAVGSTTGKMTPYETMIYNGWLPKIRHTVKY